MGKNNSGGECITSQEIPKLREVTYSTSSDVTLVVPTKLCGLQLDAVVDTAAQVTIINEKFLSDISTLPSHSEKIILREASQGSSMLGRVYTNVPLILGGNAVQYQAGGCSFK